MTADSPRRPGALARGWRAWRGTLFFIAGMLVFRSAVADWMVVPTGSMNPTVVEGDRVLVDKRAYGVRLPFTLRRIVDVGEPARGDVVVLESPADGTTLLKRVVAIPGDVVELAEDRLSVDGRAADYAPLPASTGAQLPDATKARGPRFFRERSADGAHAVMLMPHAAVPRSFGPVRVPAGRYLVLGDNRDESADSRVFGFVDRAAIFGRATRVVVSLDPDHGYRPRAGRWFEPAL